MNFNFEVFAGRLIICGAAIGVLLALFALSMNAYDCFGRYHTVSTRKLLDSNITSVSSSVYHKKGCEEKCIYLLMEGNISCKCMTTEDMKEYLDSNK